jgi:hypothetical protein
MPNLAQLKNAEKPRPIKVPFGDEVVNMLYAPGRVTPADLEAFAELDMSDIPGQARGALVGADSLATILVEWDITGDDDELLPITPANCRELPSLFIQAIQTAIEEDQRPPEKKSGSFASG